VPPSACRWSASAFRQRCRRAAPRFRRSVRRHPGAGSPKPVSTVGQPPPHRGWSPCHLIIRTAARANVLLVATAVLHHTVGDPGYLGKVPGPPGPRLSGTRAERVRDHHAIGLPTPHRADTASGRHPLRHARTRRERLVAMSTRAPLFRQTWYTRGTQDTLLMFFPPVSCRKQAQRTPTCCSTEFTTRRLCGSVRAGNPALRWLSRRGGSPGKVHGCTPSSRTVPGSA
jgi:hypothetical protein